MLFHPQLGFCDGETGRLCQEKLIECVTLRATEPFVGQSGGDAGALQLQTSCSNAAELEATVTQSKCTRQGSGGGLGPLIRGLFEI